MSYKAEVVDEIPRTAVKVEPSRKVPRTESLLQQLREIGKPMKLEFHKRSTIVSRLSKLASKKGYELDIKKELSNPNVYYVQLVKGKREK